MTNPLQFSVGFGGQQPDPRPTQGAPLRILFMTDLGGTCRSRLEMPTVSRPMRSVDIDTFEDLMGSEKPTLQLNLGEIKPREIDDLHPDQLCKTLEVFQTLDGLCRRLRTPSKFEAAAQEVRAMIQTDVVAPEAAPAPDDEGDADTLSRLLGKPSEPRASSPTPAGPGGFLDELMRKAIQAHIIADADPHAQQYIDAVEATATAHLRALLHDPEFQSFEAAWRGLDFLVSHLETDEDLSLQVWNVSKAELIGAMGPPDSTPDQSVLHQRIIAERQDTPFHMIVSDIVFGDTPEDLRLLATLGAMAGRSGALVLAAVAPEMIGAASWTEIATAPQTSHAPSPDWEALRSTALGRQIIAVGPKFILRMPYGKRLDPADVFFAFEELEQPGDPQAPILWGASPLLATVLIAHAFVQDGWDARLNMHRAFDGLPVVPYDEGGEPVMRPCAETYLSETAVKVLSESGVTPVVAVRNHNAVQISRFQNITGEMDGGPIGPFQT